MLKARGIKDRIQRRRHNRMPELPRWRRVRDKLIGCVRQAEERTLASLKGQYGFDRMRYGGLAANAFHLDLV